MKYKLTKTVLDVAECVKKGMKRSEILEKLNVSPNDYSVSKAAIKLIFDKDNLSSEWLGYLEMRKYLPQNKISHEVLGISKRALDFYNYVYNVHLDVMKELGLKKGKTLDVEKTQEEIEREVREDVESNREFFREQSKFWQKKYKALAKMTAFETQMIELFKKELQRYKGISYFQTHKKKQVGKEKEELVLVLSDWHLGEDVNKEETLNINEYNVDVAIKRVQKIYKSLLSVVDKMSGYEYETLNIFALGDMVSGIIHDELLQETAAMDQVIITGGLLAEMVYNLSKKFKYINFSGIVGNHGRIQKVPYNKKKWNNFDYLVYKMAEIKCENLDNVNFIIPKSPMMIYKIYDWNFLLRHGDSRVQSYAGIPFYGIKRADNNISSLMSAYQDTYIHYHVLGHFHNQSQLEKTRGKIIMNGSLKGTDEYSLNNYFSASDPKQLMFSVSEKYGISWSLDLFAGEVV